MVQIKHWNREFDGKFVPGDPQYDFVIDTKHDAIIVESLIQRQKAMEDEIEALKGRMRISKVKRIVIELDDGTFMERKVE